MSRIAVLGAGVVGRNLAARFAELGHEVIFGARHASSDKVIAALAEIDGATASGIAEAVDGADIAVLAVPFGAVGDVLAAMGHPGDTIIVDATNAVGASLPTGVDDIAQLVLRAHPDATVVKAFNTIGAEAYLHPSVGDHAYFLPIAGPQPAASVVCDLATEMGFDAMVIGGIDAAELLESHARLWIHLAFGVGLGRDFGFVRVERSST